MTELLNIKNGLVAVLKKDRRTSENLIKSYENVSLDEIFENPRKYSEIDLLSTQVLRQFLYETSYNIDPEQYSNELATAHKPNQPKQGNIFLHYPYKVKEDKIPKALKNIGIELKREVQYLYAEWDEKSEQVIFKDKKKSIVEYIDQQAFVEGKTICLLDTILSFSEKDFEALKKIETKINEHEKKLKISDATDMILEKAPKKDRELYEIYNHFLTNEQDKNYMASLTHEFKHIKNKGIQDSRIKRPNMGSICPEHALEIEIEDERTASIEEIVQGINTYLKQDDLDNFYEIYCDKIVDDLEQTKPEKRHALLLNKAYVVNKALENWKDALEEAYDEQFQEGMEDYASIIPLQKTKKDDKEKDLILNSFYTFPFYNPETDKEEFINTYKLIKSRNKIKINASARKKYILPAEQILAKRNAAVQELLPTSQISAETIKKAEEMAFCSINEERQKKLKKHKIYNNKQNYFHQILELEQKNLSPQKNPLLKALFSRIAR